MPETRTRPRQARARIPDAPRPDLPDQVMMPLLDRIVRQSLDEDYQVVARREAQRQARRPAGRRAAPVGPPRVRPRRVAAAVMAVFGVLVAIAAVQTSKRAPETNAGRESLIAQVQARRATVTRLQGRIDRLQTGIASQRDALSQAAEDEQVLTTRTERIGVRTGYLAVRGPGVRITLDDTPGGDITQVVRASDLAMLVDGLWNAGAEAIAVNDLRLTATTAFANVGLAVHIGKIPLVPPYTIEAIGDPDTLAADLLDTTFGQRFYALSSSLGFPYQIKSDDSMSLPAAPGPKLLWVRLPDSGNRPEPDAEGNAP
jgi:uncharacterized protein YlxW (UPF0749 family)